ncbi:MAG TPA: hypothetical protein VGF99_22500, partial [Myxococcota bacterium]
MTPRPAVDADVDVVHVGAAMRNLRSADRGVEIAPAGAGDADDVLVVGAVASRRGVARAEQDETRDAAWHVHCTGLSQLMRARSAPVV